MTSITNLNYLPLIGENKRVKNFFYGRYYPFFLCFFTALCYHLNTATFGLLVIGILACVSLLTYRDFTPFIPLPMFVTMLFKDFSFFSNTATIVILLLVGVCLVMHFYIYPIKTFNRGRLFFPLILVCCALFCGGMGSEYTSDYYNGIPSFLSVGPLILFVYVLFCQYIDPPEHFDIKSHLCAIFTAAGMCAALQEVFHRYYMYIELPEVHALELGWANINSAASFILMTMPACWYLLCRQKKLFRYSLALIILYLGLFASKSDGCIALSIVFFPIIAVFMFVRSDRWHHKMFIKIFLFLLIAVVLIIGLNFSSFDKENIESIIEIIMPGFWNDTNRTPIYKEALLLFKENPLFGAGLGYYNPNLNNFTPDDYLIARIFLFHSTFFHVIATMGIIGLFAYTVYYIARYRIIMAKNTAFNLFAYFSFSMFAIYGMIDACEFNAMPHLMFITVLLIIVEITNKRDNYSLPLYDKPHF